MRSDVKVGGVQDFCCVGGMDPVYNGKRPHPLYEGDMVERNERQKRRNQRGYSGNMPLPDDVIFRILCPSQKIDSVIGNGGSVIKTLQQDSGAKIKIADAIPGVDYRVIIISGRDHVSLDRGRSRKRDGGKDREEQESSPRDGEKLSAAQEALFKVHACFVETLGGASDHEKDPSQQVVTRLLVPNNQIGCLLGKGGKIIEQMRQSTGAQIRVLPKDQHPGCAVATDGVVQVSGDASVLKKALLSISSRLQDNPPRDRLPSFPSPAPAFVPVNDYLPPPRDSYRSKDDLMGLGPEHLESDPWAVRGGSQSLDRPDGRRRKEGGDSGENELVFRLLCPKHKIGSVIGEGGCIIDSLRKETGACIKINDVVPGSDERVLTVSAFELPGDSISPAIEAMIRVQGRITAEDGIVTTRLLVPTSQIGCLLGNGGSMIEDMQRATRANIRILSKENLPRCAKDTEELVQIVGDPTVAHKAFSQVLGSLRNNAFRESELVRGGGGDRDYRHSMPSLSMSGDEHCGSYCSGSHGGGNVLRNHGQGTSLDIKSTLEVHIPDFAVGSVIGKDGSNIVRIREISGAKVKLHNNELDSREWVLELSGTQDQTHLAQSLVQSSMGGGGLHSSSGIDSCLRKELSILAAVRMMLKPESPSPSPAKPAHLHPYQ